MTAARIRRLLAHAGGPVALLMLASLLSSCATPVSIDKHDYPRDWSPLVAVPERACPNIAGLYRDAAAACADWSLSKCKLSRALLAPLPWGKEYYLWEHKLGQEVLDAVTLVRIEQPSDAVLDVELLRSDTRSVLWREELSTAKGQFKCSPDGLVISKASFDVPSGIAAVYSRSVYTFRVSENHWLLINEEKFSTGLALIIPAYFDQSAWWRWDRLPEPNSESP